MDKKREEEFIALVRQHEKVIYKVCTFYVSQAITVDDLYQETLINLWRAFSSFRGNSAVSTWIYRLSLNTCISYLRRERRRVPAAPLKEHQDVPPCDDDAEDKVKELYAKIEMLNSIEKAIIFLLLEEKSYREIAEITGLSATNVGVRINRIKNKMKQT